MWCKGVPGGTRAPPFKANTFVADDGACFPGVFRYFGVVRAYAGWRSQRWVARHPARFGVWGWEWWCRFTPEPGHPAHPKNDGGSGCRAHGAGPAIAALETRELVPEAVVQRRGTGWARRLATLLRSRQLAAVTGGWRRDRLSVQSAGACGSPPESAEYT